MRRMYKAGLYLNVILHYFIFCCFVITGVVGWIYMPVWLYISVASLIARVLFSRDVCPLNLIEDYFRLKLDIPPIKGFVKEYVLNLPKTLKMIWNWK